MHASHFLHLPFWGRSGGAHNSNMKKNYISPSLVMVELKASTILVGSENLNIIISPTTDPSDPTSILIQSSTDIL